jgi:hypothetical protein
VCCYGNGLAGICLALAPLGVGLDVGLSGSGEGKPPRPVSARVAVRVLNHEHVGEASAPCIGATVDRSANIDAD